MSSKSTFGKLIIFGSGETSETAKKVHRKVFKGEPSLQRVAVFETPAGFQPNSQLVAKEVAEHFRFSLPEFIENINVISARKKNTSFSPDNASVLSPVENATFLFLGPGSPTYARAQFENSLALQLIVKRWRNGAILSLSSAAAISFGEFVLPVYEIYKAGADLYWEEGLNVFQEVGLPITIVTHWNNNEGGEKLDTSRCFMGKNRFEKLLKLLPKDIFILGIDENTATIFDFQSNIFSIEGKGDAFLLRNGEEVVFENKKSFAIESIKSGKKKEVQPPSNQVLIHKPPSGEKQKIEKNQLSQQLQKLLNEREKAKEAKDFKRADEIRSIFRDQGFVVEDTQSSQEVYKK